MTDVDAFTDRRKVIDRAALSEALNDLAEDHAPDSPALRAAVLQLLKDALAAGHGEVRQRFEHGEVDQIRGGRQAVGAWVQAIDFGSQPDT